MRKAKGDMKKIEMEKEEEENEGGGAETTMETEVHATATANRAQVEWMGVTDAADGGAMVAYDGSLEEMLDAVDSSVP